MRIVILGMAWALAACVGDSDVGEQSDAETSASEDTSASTDTGDATDTDDTTEVPDLPPDLPPPLLCEPSGGGPYWLLEQESVDVQIICNGELVVDGSGFTIDPLPAGAVFDPATATLSWTPGLDQGAVYELTITVTETGETAIVKIGVADRWDDPQNVPVVDPLIYTEEYGLPVLHLLADPGIHADGYTPATTIYRGHTYANEAKLRGASSLGYPKNSYTLYFTKEDKFSEPLLAGGFFDKRKVVLISTFDDNSYVRQRLAYELWNLLDPGHIQIQVYSGVLFLNGAYHGLYTIADHVDEYLMEDHGLAQTGNLYKARTHDADFRIDGKLTPHDGLTKEEGTPLDGEPGAYDDLDALITFVATADDASFDAQIDPLIDRRDYEDWWIFVSLIMGDDSAGKNSYHYHDPLSPGPWRFAPWDFNDSFGQTWQTLRKGYDAHPEDYTWANELFVRLLGSVQFGQPLRVRYGTTVDGLYAVDDVLMRVDSMIDETAQSALRDEERWGEQYQTYGGWDWRNDFLTYDEEVEYLRQWIIDRWAYVDGVY